MINEQKTHLSEGFVKESRFFNPEKVKFSVPQKQLLAMDGLKNKNSNLIYFTTNLMFMEDFCLAKCISCVLDSLYTCFVRQEEYLITACKY